MAQIFHPGMNTLARASIFGAVFIVAFVGWVGSAVDRSPYSTQASVVREQPIPFSHEHHVRGLGIDCRYCHTSVETSSFAGMPSTKTCMTCHSQIWRDAPMLQPVRDSWANNRPIQWNRVHNLPDFVYFNHSIHVNKGVGCATCHGQVDEMPLMWQASTLQMEWCLQCHRDPARFVRPKEQVFNLGFEPQRDAGEPQSTLGPKLVSQYRIANREALTNCSVCHR